MYKRPTSNTAPYQLRKRAEEIKKKIEEEKKNGTLTPDRLNKLQQALYMPDLFSGYFGTNERFRSPW